MMQKNKGFTLLEIIAAISLLILVGSMVLPNYSGIINEQKLKTDIATALQLEQHAKTYYIESSQIKKTTTPEKYIQDIYGGSMPKSQFFKEDKNSEDFTIDIDASGKVTIKLRGIAIIKQGQLQEIEDLKEAFSLKKAID